MAEENIQPGLVLIVVGAHLRAEVGDRPLAYRLLHQIETWLKEHRPQLNVAIAALVCTDVWYLNNEELHKYPTISLGGPGVNALSAYYHDKLNSASVRENQVLIQLDPEFTDLRASVWGMNHQLTIEALESFIAQYLDGFLRAAVTQVEPQEG